MFGMMQANPVVRGELGLGEPEEGLTMKNIELSDSLTDIIKQEKNKT